MKFILTGLGNWAPAWELIKAGVKEAEKCDFWGAVFPDQYMWDLKDFGVESYKNIDPAKFLQGNLVTRWLEARKTLLEIFL